MGLRQRGWGYSFVLFKVLVSTHGEGLKRNNGIGITEIFELKYGNGVIPLFLGGGGGGWDVVGRIRTRFDSVCPVIRLGSQNP